MMQKEVRDHLTQISEKVRDHLIFRNLVTKPTGFRYTVAPGVGACTKPIGPLGDFSHLTQVLHTLINTIGCSGYHGDGTC